MWERACSRRRWVSQHECCLTLRFREQARSHKVISGLKRRLTKEKPPNDVFCVLSAAFALALNACVYDSSRTTTTPE
ncbi:hypothetical protein EMIT0P43_30540 [Pseudomonas jessenii]